MPIVTTNSLIIYHTGYGTLFDGVDEAAAKKPGGKEEMEYV